MAKVYTKRGDTGTTSLLSGARIDKNTQTIRAVGALDELNSFIGLLRSELADPFLEEIQWNLFNAGAIVINDLSDDESRNLEQITQEDIDKLEKEMDYMDTALPKLKNFILPQGSRVVSITHVCRSVCRRVELESIGVAPQTISIYLNRLSDYFFVLARYLAHMNQTTETIWKND